MLPAGVVRVATVIYVGADRRDGLRIVHLCWWHYNCNNRGKVNHYRDRYGDGHQEAGLVASATTVTKMKPYETISVSEAMLLDTRKTRPPDKRGLK